MTRQPIVFVSHGSPMRAIEGGSWGDGLLELGAELNPSAVLVISAHWESHGGHHITASPQPGVIHDFSGFPQALFDMEYPAPGDPSLALALQTRLNDSGIEASLDPLRPLDHGAWAPLVHLFPKADRPVLQLSLPMERTPQLLVSTGKALADLCDDGVLILGSGGMVHNLRHLVWDSDASPELWAQGFDDWAASCLESCNMEELLDWKQRAPNPALAHPTSEHWDPLFVALGAAGRIAPRTIYAGFEHQNLSLRSVIWD